MVVVAVVVVASTDNEGEYLAVIDGVNSGIKVDTPKYGNVSTMRTATTSKRLSRETAIRFASVALSFHFHFSTP